MKDEDVIMWNTRKHLLHPHPELQAEWPGNLIIVHIESAEQYEEMQYIPIDTEYCLILRSLWHRILQKEGIV